MFDLTGKSALVTGASGGIGGAIARVLHDAGATVGLSGTRVEPLEALAAELGERAHVLPCNLGDGEAVDALPKQAIAAMGAVDILVNNAGMIALGTIVDTDLASWRKINAVNSDGVFLGCKYGIPALRRAGGGSIINFSSQAGRRGEPNITVYCSTKAAVISITQSLALELASDNIRVNAIAPGVIDTPMWDVVDAQFATYENKPLGQKKREVGEAVPLGRMGDPRDVADPVVFLASDAARYITAQTLNVDGGNWMS